MSKNLDKVVDLLAVEFLNLLFLALLRNSMSVPG